MGGRGSSSKIIKSSRADALTEARTFAVTLEEATENSARETNEKAIELNDTPFLAG